MSGQRLHFLDKIAYQKVLDNSNDPRIVGKSLAASSLVYGKIIQNSYFDIDLVTGQLVFKGLEGETISNDVIFDDSIGKDPQTSGGLKILGDRSDIKGSLAVHGNPTSGFYLRVGPPTPNDNDGSNGLSVFHTDVRIDGNVNILKDTGIEREVLIEGNVKVEGNLTATGDLTYTTVQDMKVEDNVISLNYTESSPGVPTTTNPSSYSGIRIFRGTEQPSASIYWNETDKLWDLDYFRNIEDPRIRHVGTPVIGSDASNKKYVDDNRSKFLDDLEDVSIDFDYGSDRELVSDWDFSKGDLTDWKSSYVGSLAVDSGEVNDDGQPVMEYPVDPVIDIVSSQLQIRRSDLSGSQESAILTLPGLSSIGGTRSFSYEISSSDFTNLAIKFVVNGTDVEGPIDLSGESPGSYQSSFLVTGQADVFDLEVHLIPTSIPSPSPLVSITSLSVKYSAISDQSHDGKVLLFDYTSNTWNPGKMSYSDLTGQPGSSAFTLTGLSDTTDTPLGDGYLRWNTDGEEVEYSLTIPAYTGGDPDSNHIVTGLSDVAYLGEITRIDDVDINFGTGDNTDPSVISQFLYYDNTNSKWINKNLDQLDLSSDPISIVDLADTDSNPISGGYLKWNSFADPNNALVGYIDFVPAEDIIGLAPIAYTGDVSDASSINIRFTSLVDTDELSDDPTENGLLVWSSDDDWIDGRDRVFWGGITKGGNYLGTVHYGSSAGSDANGHLITRGADNSNSVIGLKVEGLDKSTLGTYEDEVFYRITFNWTYTTANKSSIVPSFEVKYILSDIVTTPDSSNYLESNKVYANSQIYTWIKDRITDNLIIIINQTESTPPGSPSNRDAYIVPLGGNASWGIPDYHIAIWDEDGGVWESITPKKYDAIVDYDIDNTEISNEYFFKDDGTWGLIPDDNVTNGYVSFEFDASGSSTDEWIQVRLADGYLGDKLLIDTSGGKIISIDEVLPEAVSSENLFYNGDFGVTSQSEWSYYSLSSGTLDTSGGNLSFVDNDTSSNIRTHVIYSMFYVNVGDIQISFDYTYAVNTGGGTVYELRYDVIPAESAVNDNIVSVVSTNSRILVSGIGSGSSSDSRVLSIGNDYTSGSYYLVFYLITDNENDSFTLDNISINRTFETHNIIRYNGGINDASDVDTSSPITDGQALLWQTDKWVPSNLAKELYTWVALDSIVDGESNGPELSNGVGYVVNTSLFATPEVYLPKFPQPNDSIGIVVNGPNPLTINGNGPNINGEANVTLGSDGDSISLVYPGDVGNGFSGEWEILNSGVGGGGGNATAILLTVSGQKLEPGSSYYLDSVTTPGIIAHLPNIPSNGDTIKVYGAASGEGYVYADESDNPPNLIRTKDGDFDGIIVDFLGEITFVWIGGVWNTSQVPLPEYTHPTHTARNVDTTGADIIDAVTSDSQGHVTDVTSRTLTLGELGFTGDTNANNYTHPTGDGYEHIPAGGQLGQYLASDGAGSVVWHNSMVVHNKSGNATYTLAASDNGASMWFDDPSVTVTVPIGLPSGFNILIRNKGGTLTVQPQNTEVLINDVNASFNWDDPSRYHTVLLEYIDETPDPDVFYYVVVGNTTQV